MTVDYDRDLRGYGANPPDPKWPIALNFVINVEEGSDDPRCEELYGNPTHRGIWPTGYQWDRR